MITPDAESVSPRPARWVQTLNGPWATETYGIVEYLRVHPVYRTITAVLGLIACLLALSGFAGLKLWPGHFAFPFIVFGPWLLWIATISGPDFAVVFPPQQAAEDKREAEARFEKTHSVEDALRLDSKTLNVYYTINQVQARSSFRWAVLSLVVGFSTIIAGIWFFYIRAASPDVFMASISTAAGIVVNILSGTFLYLHSKTQDRSLLYYQQLSRLQRITLAIRLAQTHENADARREARDLVIKALIASNDLSTPTLS